MKIVSGGQTGVDRAALDVAAEAGLVRGGWCPRGRLAEDGPIAASYPLEETPSSRYAQRTHWNVRDSDGTLILSSGPLSGGTALTARAAQQQGKPVHVVDLETGRDVGATIAWLAAEQIDTLNVAGPRASGSPGIYERARVFLLGLFTSLSE